MQRFSARLVFFPQQQADLSVCIRHGIRLADQQVLLSVHCNPGSMQCLFLRQRDQLQAGRFITELLFAALPVRVIFQTLQFIMHRFFLNALRIENICIRAGLFSLTRAVQNTEWHRVCAAKHNLFFSGHSRRTLRLQIERIEEIIAVLYILCAEVREH